MGDSGTIKGYQGTSAFLDSAKEKGVGGGEECHPREDHKAGKKKGRDGRRGPRLQGKSKKVEGGVIKSGDG